MAVNEEGQQGHHTYNYDKSPSDAENQRANIELQKPVPHDKTIIFSPTVGTNLGSPTALGIGAFATTLTTLSLSLMGWRDISVTNVFIANFFFLAGVGMVVTAQWELVRGNSFGYTVLAAFGLFYAGFGAIITPSFGVAASYTGGTSSAEYNNALGFWVLMWAVLNLFFTIGSATINLVYFLIFLFVEMAFILIAAGYLALADGHATTSNNCLVTGGVFAFLAGLCGYYTVGHLMCQDALFFRFPMGDTSHFFVRHELNEERPTPQHA